MTASNPRPAGGASNDAKAATAEGMRAPSRGLGLSVATALVMGSIIGVGIFNLPTSLSFYGPISLVSMGLTTIGAVALALLFAALSRRLPADGGPYAYSRVAFGNRLGFANAWSYWITAWAGNAAIAVGWVLYVEEFVNTGHNRFFSVLLVLAGLWIPAAINLSRRQEHGLGPGVDDDPQVRGAACSCRPSASSSSTGPTTRHGTSAARARSPRSVAAWRSPCSATSASRSQRSRPPR